MKIILSRRIVTDDVVVRVATDDGVKVRDLTEGEEAALVMFLESEEGRGFVDRGASFPGECGEVIYEDVGGQQVAVARCTRPMNQEHSHNVHTPTELVALGFARVIPQNEPEP